MENDVGLVVEDGEEEHVPELLVLQGQLHLEIFETLFVITLDFSFRVWFDIELDLVERVQ